MQNLIFDLDNTLYPRNLKIEAEFGIRTKDYLIRRLALDFADKKFDWAEISTHIEEYLDRIFAGKAGAQRLFGLCLQCQCQRFES